MKQKLLRDIDEFYNLCYMMFKIGAGDFAKEKFPKLIENIWDNSKSDEENLNEVKSMFETNKKLNELLGNSKAAEVIAAFQDAYLNKL